VQGPILARPAAGGTLSLYVPRPADALYFGQGDTARCLRAAPKPFEPHCGADLPDGLLPVQLAEPPEGKEAKGSAWWAWDDFVAFRNGEAPAYDRLTKNGWSPPPGDRRTHVAIDRASQAASTGRLFQTEGLDFAPPEGVRDDPTSDLRLLVRTAEPLSTAVAHLGGERRLAALEPQPASAWPTFPGDWVERIQRDKGVVLTLLTPVLFSAGYRPGWLCDQVGDDGAARWAGSPPGMPNLRLELRAAALGRWQPHSGWDLEQQQPRAGRKLVPAGAVYWFSLLGEPEQEDLAKLWLASLCDNAQDRRDGFGLALPAPWQPPTTDSPSNTPK
jgi:CRISPR-associated protein Cmr3